MIFFDDIYNKGYEAGLNKARLENQEAQNRRLEEMFRFGKDAGIAEGWKDGYTKGYECGYSEGEIDAKAEIGVIDLDGVLDEVGEAKCGSLTSSLE